jgi:hypothetical protein
MQHCATFRQDAALSILIILLDQPGFNRVNHLFTRWENPKQGLCAAVNDDLSVDQNLVLTVMSFDLYDIDVQFSLNPSRHTDGMYPRDSKGTISNCDSRHYLSPPL